MSSQIQRKVFSSGFLSGGRGVTQKGKGSLGDILRAIVEDQQKIIDWVTSNDIAIQFPDDSLIGVHGTPVEVDVVVADGDGTPDSFNSYATVDISITGGTATGKTINGVAGPVTVEIKNGVASVQVDASSAGSIVLGLSGGNTSLDKTDTITIALS